MDGGAVSEAPRGRPALVLAAALVALSVLEVFSCAALRVAEGRWIGLADLDAARVRRIAGDRRDALAPGAAAGGGEAIRSAHVLHPFLGYVMDPALVGEDAERLGIDPTSLELGFPRNAASVLQPRAEERVVIGVFGGSVADLFTVSGAAALRARLGTLEPFRGREIVLLSIAAPGYKQPQQAMALGYLLALGAHFDWVVNIDGLNDVALPPQELAPLGVAPFFPRGWYARAASLAPALRRRIADVAALEDRRARAARLFASAPLRFSRTAGLVWLALDRRLGAQLGAAEAALVAERPEGHDVQAQGPRLAEFASGDPEAIARLWARASLQMHHLCRGLGIGYLHVLQPNQYVPDAKPMGPAERRLAFREDSPFRAPVEAGYPALQRAGAELAAQDVAFVDATQLFAGVEAPAYADDCCHLDPSGNARLAGLIASAIAARVAPAADAVPEPETPAREAHGAR